MKEKKIKCYEVEVKLLVRNECTKKELKKEIEDQINSISYRLEELEVNVR